VNDLPVEIVTILYAFQPLFSRPVFEHAKVLLLGAILAPGRRTVASVLRVMGKAEERRFEKYHRVLSRAAWSGREAARILLLMLLRVFVPEGTVLFGVDETIERRWGKKISARGIYRDPVRSSRSHFVKTSGLRWISLMLLTPIRWAGRVWALPFLTELAPSERYYEERGLEHKTLLDRAAEMLERVTAWLPGRQIVVAGDGSYSALEFLDRVRKVVTMVTRLRLDAALYEPAPERKAHQPGRPALKGKRLPTPEQKLKQRKGWRLLKLQDWYGQGPRKVWILPETAVWYHKSLPPVPLRWVLIRDPLKKFEPQALLCTDLKAKPAQIVEWFIQRWPVEVTFEETRAHLGLETQRQWTDKAIARCTPILLALYSIITLMAHNLVANNAPPVRTAAWYRKDWPTFSDALALVRRSLWASEVFSMSSPRSDNPKIPAPVLGRLMDTLCYGT
jgi:hypothetical protein